MLYVDVLDIRFGEAQTSVVGNQETDVLSLKPHFQR
jgi:hypothetical protein